MEGAEPCSPALTLVPAGWWEVVVDVSPATAWLALRAEGWVWMQAWKTDHRSGRWGGRSGR